jgi:hypothetical protein
MFIVYSTEYNDLRFRTVKTKSMCTRNNNVCLAYIRYTCELCLHVFCGCRTIRTRTCIKCTYYIGLRASTWRKKRDLKYNWWTSDMIFFNTVRSPIVQVIFLWKIWIHWIRKNATKLMLCRKNEKTWRFRNHFTCNSVLKASDFIRWIQFRKNMNTPENDTRSRLIRSLIAVFLYRAFWSVDHDRGSTLEHYFEKGDDVHWLTRGQCYFYVIPSIVQTLRDITITYRLQELS